MKYLISFLILVLLFSCVKDDKYFNSIDTQNDAKIEVVNSTTNSNPNIMSVVTLTEINDSLHLDFKDSATPPFHGCSGMYYINVIFYNSDLTLINYQMPFTFYGESKIGLPYTPLFSIISVPIPADALYISINTVAALRECAEQADMENVMYKIVYKLKNDYREQSFHCTALNNQDGDFIIGYCDGGQELYHEWFNRLQITKKS